MKRTFPRVLVSVIMLSLFGCKGEDDYVDKSTAQEFRHVVGAKYVVTREISAYGIRRPDESEVYVTALFAPPGISGPEVAYSSKVPAGSTITILKVVETNRWLPSEKMALVVHVEDANLPIDIPIRIDLYGGNKGNGDFILNPEYFKKQEP